ncbi:hypothetical protein, partial [Coleofasciculus sp.]|uniref:hypothetical protein n=1 Tax=Coleofasciculus sp. TaxID=3100458 RepID=UPI003A236916
HPAILSPLLKSVRCSTAGRAGLFTNQLAEELLKALYNQYFSPLLPIAYCPARSAVLQKSPEM